MIRPRPLSARLDAPPLVTLAVVAGAALLPAGVGAAAPAAASSPHAEVCAASITLDGALSGWSRPHARTAAAKTLDSAGSARLVPGTASEVGLFEFDRLQFGQTGAQQRPGGFGGILSFETRVPGNWRVALGPRAWIDVVDGGKVIPSHAHYGPRCSGIAKLVDVTLPAGRHTLLISSSPGPLTTVLVTRGPRSLQPAAKP